MINILLNQDNGISATNYEEIYLFSHAQIYIRFLSEGHIVRNPRTTLPRCSS